MDSPVWCAPISRAVVFGGTHGNEMAGVCLAKHWMKNPSEIQRQTFTTECCIANPLAVERCVRYIDQDLNRCFSMEILRSPAAPSDSYELKRARDIFHKYGSGDSAVDFALDLHNTTANMGVTYLLCRNNDLFSVHLVNYLQSKSGDLPLPFHCSLTDVPEKDLVYLHRIAKRSLCLEIGPQPHGVIRADILSAMREIVNHVLDFIDLFNQGKEFPGFEMDNYTFFSRVDFPRDSKGEVEAVIHSELQDKDFAPLKPGDPIFKTLDGKDILYEGEKILYPMFINEAAYYEKKVAFVLTEKVRCTFPALKLMH
ncbi:N-acyl-aromatic-L-amino acid amidohydrolase (carboxylate-forming)-like [Hyperolius riggenbachi]|uniref:N-acyl-aromatic-L-amino acid amidohydrolase (carboxylate-forming)-like n=1 Tax=Hyperolius riggenbachi TaxID=752182 RepID=UPI0035A2EB21